ncbi:MAG: hypothetical protein M1838_004554 [Thelocarpon superellum]|nr:MAG: hypothetical protein M1838_004554 [Thelocarpon superellum]
MNVTTRLLETDGSGMNPLQILFVRMAVTVILCCAYMWYTDVPHFPLGQVEVRGILALRGIGGFFGVFGLYYSLQYLPLAEATVLTFLAPILACWACAVLIKEPFSRMEQAAGLVSLFGVILIARPFSSLSSAPPGTIDIGKSDGMVSPNGTVDIISVGPPPVTAAQRLTAVGVAMVGVIGAACAYTTIRWIGKRAHPLISVNYFATWCTIVSTVALLVLPDIGFQLPRDVRQWLYLIILGVTGFIMQFLLTAGLAYEKSSRGTNMIYTLMLFALAFDKLVWGTNPDLTSVTGGSLILGAAIYVAACQGSRKSALESTDAHKNGETADEERGLVNGIDDDEDDDDEPSVLPLEDSFRGVPEAPLRSARI